MSTRLCRRCGHRGDDFVYVPHAYGADNTVIGQDFWRCPDCGAPSTALDKRTQQLR